MECEYTAVVNALFLKNGTAVCDLIRNNCNKLFQILAVAEIIVGWEHTDVDGAA